MRKELTAYSIKEEGKNLQILKDKEIVGHTTYGIVACLECVFTLEGSNKEDWYIEEDKKIYKVNADEHRKETLTEDEYIKYKKRCEEIEEMNK